MGYKANFKRLALNTVIDMQGEATAISDWCDSGLPDFPEVPNTATTKNKISLYWIAPARWLLRTTLGREEELLSLTKLSRAPANISVVQISDTLQFFSITGEDAPEILSVASPIDFHPSAFPANGVSYTEIFGIKGLLIRNEHGFELAVERSFGDMVEDFLIRTIE